MIVIRRNPQGDLEAVQVIGESEYPKGTCTEPSREDQFVEKQHQWAIQCGFTFVNEEDHGPMLY
jgi:hypothetical protein